MKKTCSSCQHWHEEPELFESVQRRCGAITDLRDDENPERSATAVDYESYAAWLLAGPEFGCMLWQVQEEEVSE